MRDLLPIIAFTVLVNILIVTSIFYISSSGDNIPFTAFVTSQDSSSQGETVLSFQSLATVEINPNPVSQGKTTSVTVTPTRNGVLNGISVYNSEGTYLTSVLLKPKQPGFSGVYDPVTVNLYIPYSWPAGEYYLSLYDIGSGWRNFNFIVSELRIGEDQLEIQISPASVRPGNTLSISVSPTDFGVTDILMFYNESGNEVAVRGICSEIQNFGVCYNSTSIEYTIPESWVEGQYYMRVFDLSGPGWTNKYFQISRDLFVDVYPTTLDPGETINIDIIPGSEGIYNYIRILDINNKSMGSVIANPNQSPYSVNHNPANITYTIPSNWSDGDYQIIIIDMKDTQWNTFYFTLRGFPEEQPEFNIFPVPVERNQTLIIDIVPGTEGIRNVINIFNNNSAGMENIIPLPQYPNTQMIYDPVTIQYKIPSYWPVGEYYISLYKSQNQTGMVETHRSYFDVIFTCEDTDSGINYYQQGIVTYYNGSMTDYCDTELKYLHEATCNTGYGYPGMVAYKCPSGCSNGACVQIINNTKTPSKYSEKEVFLISSSDWRNVLGLVPLTTWTGGEEWCKRGTSTPSGVCTYPTLLYHEDTGDYDIDSSIYFMQQYGADKVTIIGNSPPEIDTLLFTEPNLGSGIDEQNIKRIFPSDYFSYWSSYSDIVYSQDDYSHALLSSVYASLINAPLVIKGSDLDSVNVFSGKNTICVGQASPSSGCSERFTLEELQEEYISLTGTKKTISVNPDDLNSYHTPGPLQTERLNSVINNLNSRTSLPAPILAAAKHEVIIFSTGSQTPVHDQSIERDLQRLYGISTLLQTRDFLDDFFLTIIASGDAIPYKSIENYRGIANDQYYYGNFGNGGPPNISVGRIFGFTTSDVSSLIARSIFYDDTRKTDKATFLATRTMSNLPNTTIPSFVWEWSEIFREVRSDVEFDFSTLLFYFFDPSLWENSDLLVYIDHGLETWAGIYSNEIPYLNNTVMFVYACSTCADLNQTSFCGNAVRKGAISYIGAVEKAYTGNPIYGETLNNVYYLNMSIGEAFNRAYNVPPTLVLPEKYYRMITLIGDPTLHFDPLIIRELDPVW